LTHYARTRLLPLPLGHHSPSGRHILARHKRRRDDGLERLSTTVEGGRRRCHTPKRVVRSRPERILALPDLEHAKGVHRIGVRLGNWLTPEQGRRLLAEADVATPRARRDHAMLAMLIGCGLRRAELLALTLESIQLREDHWVVADLVGKGQHVRTVPIPTWVKNAIDEWTVAAGITHGVLFRAINKAGRVWGDGMSPKVLWDVVRAAAGRANIDKLAPHDLRRTCARLCHLAGGELDQIQFLLGHVSIQTTERYLGCKQKLRCAVNDRLGIEPGSTV